MELEKLKEYNTVFNDAWKFFKHYAGMIPLTEAVRIRRRTRTGNLPERSST